MKNVIIGLCALALLTVAAVAFADKSLPVYKKGDPIYVCTCGDSCDCKTMAHKEGKCGCGSPLGKGVVNGVSKDKITVAVDGKTLTFPAKAKYACGCGDGCSCGTVSQKPGKCGCGSDMKKVR